MQTDSQLPSAPPGSAPPGGYASFRDVILNDPYVNSIVKQGGTAEMCVVELANQKQELLRRVIQLEAIVPRKLQLEDGRIMVWRCPDELVPLTRHNAPGERPEATT